MMRAAIRAAACMMLMQGAALAATDYRCLQACVGGGKSSAACMEECAYEEQDDQAPKPTREEAYTPREFDTMRPATKLVPPSDTPKPQKPKPEKDYICMSECLHDGMQYQMCEKRCVRK